MISSQVRGQGPDVVWAHGMGVSRHMWQAQIDVLSQQFRCISYDARGHGDSPAEDVPLSIAQAVEDLMAAADQHGSRRFALVGASMGARTAIEATLAHPECVRALVISDITDQSGPRAQQRLLDAADQLDAADHGWQAILAAGPGADVYVRHEVSHGRVPFAGHDRTALASTLRNLSAGRPGLADLADAFTSIGCPVLIVYGGEDAPSRAASHTVAGLIDGAQVADIPHAGHLAALAAPTAYTEIIERFLFATSSDLNFIHPVTNSTY